MNRYGTTADMVIRAIDDNGTTRLVAIDKDGLYLTTQDRVDRMLADVNRYGVPRELTNKTLEALGIDPHQMFEEHRNRINMETIPDGNRKLLNPIKASKRKM